jgi:competence protein ComEC
LPQYQDGQKSKIRLILQQDPQLAGDKQVLISRLPSGDGLTIQTLSNSTYSYGDTLQLEGILKQKVSSSGRKSFVMYYPKITLTDNGGVLWQGARTIRTKSQELYHKVLPPISASLLIGIVFGIKEQYPHEFLQDLQVVGVLHVIAASGMNVSFVAGVVLFSLGSFLKRKISLFLSISAVVFYTFIVGFQSSILRASIMAIIAFTASILGKQNFGLFSLILTAVFMLYWQPSLLFDVSFQLSFLSTIGILLVKPVLDSGAGRLGRLGKSGIVKGDMTTTLSAQLGTLPVMLGTFGNYGVLSILVNALILWTVPILMITGSLAVLFAFVFEPVSYVFLWISYPFLLFFQVVVSYFGESGLLITLQNVPGVIWIGYYCLLLGFVLFAQLRKKRLAVETTISEG